MRPIPDGIRANPDSCYPAPASPRLRSLAKLPSDPFVSCSFRNDQPADQSRGLGLQVVFDAQIDPPHHSVIHTRHQDGAVGIGSNLPYPAKQDREIRGVAQLLT